MSFDLILIVENKFQLGFQSVFTRIKNGELGIVVTLRSR